MTIITALEAAETAAAVKAVATNEVSGIPKTIYSTFSCDSERGERNLGGGGGRGIGGGGEGNRRRRGGGLIF